MSTKLQNKEEREANRIANKKKALRQCASIFNGGLKLMLSIPYWVGRRIGMEDMSCNLLMPFAEAVEMKSNCFVTYNLYPKETKNQNNWLYYASTNAKKFCIVIQGPILKKYDFTLETVRYYGKIYPDVLVIVSTWETENQEYLKKFQNEKNCIILLNKQPDYPGNGNINYQIVSSLEGMKEAMRLGKNYILKTRSDTRVTASGILEVLYQYVKQYTLTGTAMEKQKDRLVFFNMFLFHPYHISDFFCFGAVEDMINFYDVEWNKEEKIDNAANRMIANKWSYRDLFNNPNGENEICMKYFKKINGDVHCDLQEWWDVLEHNVVALPLNFIKPIWIKYDYNHEESNFYVTFRRKIMGGDGLDNTKVDFNMWIDMYNSKFQIKAKDYEYILDLPLS